MIGVFNLVAWIVIAGVIMLLVGGSMFAAMMGGGDASVARGAAAGLSMLLAVLIGLALSIPVYMAIWVCASAGDPERLRAGPGAQDELRRVPEELRAVPASTA